VTNGPFKFDEWVKGDHITLVRNENYYLGAPDVDKWVRRIYADTPSAMAAYLAGQVDIINVEREDVGTIEAEIANGEPFAIKPLLSDGYSYLAMNNGDPYNPEMGWVDENENESFDEGEPVNMEQGKHPILSDKLVRQAIAYAIDYDDIIQQVALGQGAPLAANVIPAVSWAYNSNLEPYALDIEKAALLLDEAGWVLEGNGVRMKDGKPLALSIITNADNTDREKMAAIIKEDLDAVGFDITVELFEWGTFVTKLLGQEFDMAVLGWIGLGSDPDDSEFWAYRYDEPDVGFNFTSYYNEEVESKLFEANSLVGCPLQDRAALYHDIQAQIHEDAPYAFLFTPMTNVAWNTRLHGINPGPWSTYYNVEEWSITP
jgi:peptide/nickel transport system substrate-binding protein